jgi:DNA adenine methylase
MFIPYLGEKSKFSNFIIPNIPTDISTYVEPFGGMMGIFFSLDLKKFPNTQFIYNDSNWLNYNLFSQLQNPEFIEVLESLKPSEEQYSQIQSDLLNNNWTSQEAALNWLTILCCSASQFDILNGQYKGNAELEIFKLKLKFGKDRLSKISKVYNLDYQNIIHQFDSIDTFFYLDPPYKNREHYYINHSFDESSHFELSQVLKSIKGRFALSYYHFPEIEDWYKDCRIISNRSLMGTEYLIMNY